MWRGVKSVHDVCTTCALGGGDFAEGRGGKGACGVLALKEGCDRPWVGAEERF